MPQQALHRPRRMAPPPARLQASACNSMTDRCLLGKAPVFLFSRRAPLSAVTLTLLHEMQTIGHLRPSADGWQPTCLAIRLFGKLDQHFFTDWDLHGGWAPCIVSSALCYGASHQIA